MIKFLKDKIYQYQHRLDIFLSRIWYRNLTGANLNWVGLKKWEENRKLLGLKRSNNFPLGYRLFTLTDKNLLQVVQNKYQKIIEDQKYTFFFNINNQLIDDHKDAKFFMVKNVINSIPEVLNLLSKDVLGIISSYYQSHFRLTHVAAYRTSALGMAKKQKEVFAHRLHYDRHSVDTLKLFIALSDITEKDGPFNFFDQNYSKILLKKGYRGRDNYGKASELIENSPEAISLTGEAGTAAICNTPRCLHRAGIPESGRTRDLLVFTIESYHEHFEPLSPQTKSAISFLIDQEHSVYHTK